MQAQRSIFENRCYEAPMPGGRPAKTPRSAFGERLAHARQQAGLSQEQLAEKLGTIQRVVAHWERRPVALRAEQLAALADALGVTTDFLVGRDAPKRRGPGPVGRARRVLETVSRLPRHQQQKIIDVVEAMVAHSNGGGESRQ
jgi:transcriptional regulator with XRE-family HTH domain